MRVASAPVKVIGHGSSSIVYIHHCYADSSRLVSAPRLSSKELLLNISVKVAVKRFKDNSFPEAWNVSGIELSVFPKNCLILTTVHPTRGSDLV